ncbi:hypothetical protein IFM89_000459 [Coptis chinensis]|uniref:Uncharacterized protein n=1 Tax=Coptis chinensis TaxID=261450 RepID=A0A835IA42_9MAGN|nr:hypothetical protein IFM89_000459 [Coptis chinensis]
MVPFTNSPRPKKTPYALRAALAATSLPICPESEKKLSRKDRVKIIAEQKINSFLSVSEEKQALITLEAIIQALMLGNLLDNCDDLMIQTNDSIVLAKVAEYGNQKTVDEVLQKIPVSRLVDLLVPGTEEWHENMTLIKLLENGSAVTQHHAIIILKAFYESLKCKIQHIQLLIERKDLALQVVEKLAKLEKNSGGSGEMVVGFL